MTSVILPMLARGEPGSIPSGTGIECLNDREFAGTVPNQTGQAVEAIFMTMMVYLAMSLATSALMNWFNQRIAPGRAVARATTALALEVSAKFLG